MQDAYSVFQNSLEKYFKEIRANAASYLQATSDLQEEVIESRKKNAEHAITLQKAAYEKLGGNNHIPSGAIDFAKSLAGQTTLACNLQNRMILASLDALSKNIEAFNKNSAAFEESNKKIIDQWVSIIKKEIK
jgi:hypothetical protein